jgi:hypothetical protein
VDPSFEGKSLVGEVYGASPEPRDVVVDLPSTSDNGRRRGLVHGDEKLICFDNDGYCKLFDLVKDPLEKDPATRGEAHDAMMDRYRAFVKNVKELPPYACTGDCLNSSARRMKEQKQGQ